MNLKTTNPHASMTIQLTLHATQSYQNALVETNTKHRKLLLAQARKEQAESRVETEGEGEDSGIPVWFIREHGKLKVAYKHSGTWELV